MRIFGGHDYYDGAAAAWPDEAVWNRTPERIEEKDAPNLFPPAPQYLPIDPLKKGASAHSDRDRWTRRNRLEHVTVIFCGRVYRGIKHDQWNNKGQIFWSREDLDNWLKPQGLKSAKAYHYDPGRDPFLDHDLPDHILQEHIRAKITVLAGCNPYDQGNGQRWLTKDHDKLTELGFQQVLNATEAAQALLEWQGNILTAPDPAKITITNDKVKAEKHGFDKWSFRKMPQAG